MRPNKAYVTHLPLSKADTKFRRHSIHTWRRHQSSLKLLQDFSSALKVITAPQPCTTSASLVDARRRTSQPPEMPKHLDATHGTKGRVNPTQVEVSLAGTTSGRELPSTKSYDKFSPSTHHLRISIHRKLLSPCKLEPYQPITVFRPLKPRLPSWGEFEVYESVKTPVLRPGTLMKRRTVSCPRLRHVTLPSEEESLTHTLSTLEARYIV
jgi:hypothetical protein